MLQSTPGAINGGLEVKAFSKDRCYSTEKGEITDELVKVFLEIKVAEVYTVPVVAGHKAQAKILALNKDECATVSSEFFDDMRAGHIRQYAIEHNVDLTDQRANTSRSALIKVLLDRMWK